MPVSRRIFLRSGATAVAAGLVVGAAPRAHGLTAGAPDPKSDSQLPQGAQPSALRYFKPETFAPYVGGVFTARAGARSLEMTLKGVRECAPSAESMRVTKRARASQSFAVLFSSKGPLAPQTSPYEIEHGALGTFLLFMTRRDLPDGTHAYEAVFNHAR
jgi:hypothetical protein